jgi:hypothetical protein
MRIKLQRAALLCMYKGLKSLHQLTKFYEAQMPT